MATEDDYAYAEALDHVQGHQDHEDEMTGVEETAVNTAIALGITATPSNSTKQLLADHPELASDYSSEVERLLVQLGKDDPNHTTYPFVTLYERTKILSLRASQLAKGARPFIEVTEAMLDVHEIATAEFNARRLPFILKRPRPNGTFEYWRLSDLMTHIA